MKKESFVLYGNIVKVDGDRKTFQPYGEKRVLTIKTRDNLKVGDPVSFTLYESQSFNLLQVSLVKYSKEPVFIKSYEKINGGINAVFKTKNESLIINKKIMYSDPLFEEVKAKGQLTAAIFGNNVFLEKSNAI